MGDERLKILSMLEEGKITRGEAVKLLDALDSAAQRDQPAQRGISNDSLTQSIESVLSDFNIKADGVSKEMSQNFSGMEGKLHEMLSGSLEKLSSNFESLQKNLQNIINNITEDMDKSTVSLSSRLKEETSILGSLIDGEGGNNTGKLYRNMEDMQKNFGALPLDPSALAASLSAVFGSLMQSTVSPKVSSGLYKKSIKDSLPKLLDFECINGNVYLEGYDGYDIETEVYCVTGQEKVDEMVSVTDNDEEYGIKIMNSGDSSVSLDVKIPKMMLDNVQAVTSRGKVEISEISCGRLLCTTSRGKITLSNLECGSIDCTSSEGRIETFGIRSQKMFLMTKNSPIIIEGTTCVMSDCSTSNGSITLELDDKIYGSNEFRLTTENAPIDVKLDVPDDTGIYVDAFSFNGSIRLPGLQDFSYTTKETGKVGSSHIVGRTGNFETAKNSISIIVQTKDSQISFKQ